VGIPDPAAEDAGGWILCRRRARAADHQWKRGDDFRPGHNAGAHGLSDRSFPNPGEWRSEAGVLGAAGYEKRVGKLHLGPEVRYTWWTRPALDVQGSRGFRILSNQNQVDVLLTVRFP